MVSELAEVKKEFSMEVLSSPKNPRIMAWRSLKDRKGRLAHGLFLVEGTRMVGEALSSGFPVEAVLFRRGYPDIEAFPHDLPAYLLPEHIFDGICDTRTPQGIAAVLRPNPRPAEGPCLLALDGVQDPGNVGTILRTADAAGFDGVLLSGECADCFSPKVLRATMGSIFHIGLSFPDFLPEALLGLREKGYEILSSQLDGEPFYGRPELVPPFVLVIGNEGNGISDAVKQTATRRLRLPMRGGAESLNAAVAAGIMMYDLTRSLPD